MFNKIIKTIFRDKVINGVREDTRPQSEQDRDYAHEERAFSASTDIYKNKKITKSPYTYETQYQTSSCAYHGVGLAFQILIKMQKGFYIIFSKMFGYRQRMNYPGEGAVPQLVFNDYKTKGACLYDTLPTPQTEAEANAVVITDKMRNEANIFDGIEFYTLKENYNDIDTLANIAQKGLAIPICIFATYSEWAREKVKVITKNLDINNALIRHEVCILPYSSFIEKGVKYLTIQDSSWFGGYKLRHLDENFIKERVRTAGYWDTKVTLEGTGEKPKYKFTKILKVNSTGTEVLNLQKLLISLGLLAVDCATGKFYGKTLAAVRAFQVIYVDDILTPIGLTEPTEVWGAQCIKKANDLCK